MAANPRQIALDVLLTWHRSEKTLDHSLESHSNKFVSLTSKDKSLCNNLIFGVLRNRQFIDWTIDVYSKVPITKINLTVLYLLRIALYQIMFLDRVPDFAAIDTSVELGKKLGGKKSAGFINAILRKAVKEQDSIQLPDLDKNAALSISVRHSIPKWMIKRWISFYGVTQTDNLCRQINTIPLITARTNTLKIDKKTLARLLTEETGQVKSTRYAEDGLVFSKPATEISELKTFKKGWFQIQDEAAQIVTEYLDPRPGETILDCCAGLGGKSGHIAQLMNNQGSLTAMDIVPYKLNILKKEADRLGITNIITKQGDLLKTNIKDFDRYFDRVLVDAPCTGLGVMQRNPDTKWKRTRNDILRMSGRQKKILNAAANLVRPGGILVFAVCSCEPEENEEVIKVFLSKRKDFLIDNQFKFDKYPELTTSEGFLKTYPEPHGMDGFFSARLRRKNKNGK